MREVATATILVAIIALLLAALVIMAFWNLVLVPFFALPTLAYWQVLLGVVVLNWIRSYLR